MTPRSNTVPDVDFRQIRPYGSPATRADAFEELTSILIREGLVAWPAETVFYRFGNPDGGREGKGVLPGGDVWAWQTKYLFAFDSDEIEQVHKSVLRTLETEPNLKRYYVAFPYDLPAGDTNGPKRKTKSAHTKWLEKKAEWEALTTARGMTVDFFYLGAHELVSELTQPRHTGRLRYWFDTSMLSPGGMKKRLEDVVAKAGRRYSPQVHVEVEPVNALEGLGRTEAYIGQVQGALAGIRNARVNDWVSPPEADQTFKKSLEVAWDALLSAEASLENLINVLRTSDPLPDVIQDLRLSSTKIEAVRRLLQDSYFQDDRKYHDQAGSLYGALRKASDGIGGTLSLLKSPVAEAASSGRLLMTGRAGVGKTHLFCDVASRRMAQSLPTLVVLGQDFDAGKLLPQIGELVQLGGTLDEVLAVLDAAGEAAGCLAMLMIDAVNEAASAERWADDLRVLANAVDRYSHVVLAVSCRTEFVTHVAGDADGFPRVAHQGFTEATSAAVDRYTNEYNLDRLTFPVLNPEYGNPLFLKLACESLATLGTNHFTLGTAGLATVCHAFLDAVNKRLAGPARCDFDETTNLVQTAVYDLAATGPGPYDNSDVRRITDALLPGAPWSKSLLLGLKREGVLMDTFNDQLVFGYQRLGDVARATLLAKKSRSDLIAWYSGLGDSQWEERGTLGALAVIAPESIGEEIVDLFKNEADDLVDYEIIDAFVESLGLRAPQKSTERTARIVEQLVDSENWGALVWDQLLRVACVPGHSINADWTHRLLLSRPLPERDTTWSEWLVDQTEQSEDQAATILLDWAWSPANATRDMTPLPNDVARLSTLILGWMLTTPDRRVRDRATKALVVIGERGSAGFASALREFRGCDDPYVIERLAAAICAVALRSTDSETVTTLADAAVELVADGWPEHLLTRDYLRRTSAAAHRHGWTGPEWLPPYGAKWPIRVKSKKAIEGLNADPKYRYASILGSIDETYGDFGRYVMKQALDNFDHSDHKKLRDQAQRTVFTRVLELGWTPELFGQLDRGRHGGNDGPLERYGKKYQWIGYYEVLGRIADNYKLTERWNGEEDPFPYDFAEQIVYRDIDPTILTPNGLNEPACETTPWFAPVCPIFPPDVAKEYPLDMEGVPDPLDLITITASDESKWLSLIRHSNWTQILPPEIAALRAPNLNVWMQIRGYLVASDQVEQLRKFSKGQDWDGRWMPENAEIHSRLLGTHPDSPEWDWADGNAEPRGMRSQIPVTLFQPVAWYGGTGTSREDTGTDEPTGYVPSQMLFKLLGLRKGVDFQWSDANHLAVADPTVGMAETSTLLMRRDLSAELEDAGFSLYWTVLLNKQRLDHSYSRPGKGYRWLSASASYILDGDSIDLISASAWRCRPAPGGDPQPVAWNIRSRA